MALFAALATLAESLAGEASRLKKRAAIAEAVATLAALPTPAAPADAGRFCLYLAGQPFPEADARKLNAGGAILSRALKTVSGATDAGMTAAYRRHGDLGAAAYDLLVAPYGNAPATSTLTLSEVAEAFDAMATARSTAARSTTVEDLLRGATALEAKYLLKLMLGDMRIGVRQSLIEEGIAVAANVTVEAVRHAVMLEADLGRAVARAFAGTLAQARMTLFHPLGFMLASPVETPEEAVERFTAKPKKLPKPPPTPKRRRKSTLDPEALLPTPTAEAAYAEDIEHEATSIEPEATTAQTTHNPGAPSSPQPGTSPAEAKVGDLPQQPPSVDPTTTPQIHAFLEDKFDGIRAQLHCGDPAQPGRVAIYSRSREDITEGFPELAEACAAIDAPPGGFILDGEILGWDPVSDQALPFALLGGRIGRKTVPDDLRKTIPVVFMAFDLMYADGELYLPHPFHARRTRLEAIVAAAQLLTHAGFAAPPQTAQHALFASPDTASPPMQRLRLSRAERVESAEAVDRGYRDARARANEGVMLKAASSAYLPGRRGLAWLKLKRELATLDVVITGAEFGSGKRSQLLSDYTFAIRGPDGDLLNLGKAYQGVTDAEIAELTAWLHAHTLEDFGHFRTVEPLRVLEVAFNNIMRSDRHASGFALRFPRILRLRDDKPVSEIDTLARVAEVYNSQPDKPAHLEAPSPD